MADDAKALEIVIRTTAELEGARAAEAQLERDIAQARLLGNEYAELEAKLRSVRRALAGTEPGAGQGDGNTEIDGALSTDTTARPDRARMLQEPGREASEPDGHALPHGQMEPQEPGTEATDFRKEGTNEPVGPEGTVTNEQQDLAPVRPLTLPSPPIGEREPTAAQGDRAVIPDTNQRTRTEDAPELQINAQAQAMQAAGDRMRAALERNGQATVSLLNQALEVIEQQNRRLGEVERRISELAGQIKSSRNP